MQLPPPNQLVLLSDNPARRENLRVEIARATRVLREAWLVLSEQVPPCWPSGKEPSPDVLVESWLSAGKSSAQLTLDARS